MSRPPVAVFLLALALALALAMALPLVWPASADEPAPAPARDSGSADISAQKAALAEFNDLIGGWRGTAQIRRGSAQGSWSETADWAWEFADGGVALRYTAEQGRLLESARLVYDLPAKQYVLTIEAPEQAQRVYRGALDEGRLVLVSAADSDGVVYRIALTRLNEKRTLVLHEKQLRGQQSFQRIAEVGYTRAGTRLADRDGSGPECIVTGGLGTIKVSYKGQTYYVCCSGCKQAFDDDPEGIIAEAAERREQERRDRAQRR